MTSSKNPIDQRPFRSRAALESEKALEAQYRRLAIPEVVAAVQQLAGRQATKPAADDQER